MLLAYRVVTRSPLLKAQCLLALALLSGVVNDGASLGVFAARGLSLQGRCCSHGCQCHSRQARAVPGRLGCHGRCAAQGCREAFFRSPGCSCHSPSPVAIGESSTEWVLPERVRLTPTLLSGAAGAHAPWDLTDVVIPPPVPPPRRSS